MFEHNVLGMRAFIVTTLHFSPFQETDTHPHVTNTILMEARGDAFLFL